MRESALGADARGPNRPDTWEGWEDSAVPPDHLGEYLRRLRALLDAYGYQGSLYGHFGQGCVHTRISFDLLSERGVERFRAFLTDAAKLVTSLGGSLSGEHGDGQSRAALLPIMFGERIVAAFGAFKDVFDPTNRMNPGKVVRPFDPTENLRLGSAYRPQRVSTRFAFPADAGKFDRAVLRCVGVGACRREASGSGVMCPSYVATREEAHSTRGRARLLFEMLQGDVVTDGWKSEAVKDALDLCLACKGCKHDCPVQVDMATYKAEFLSHYYEGRLRPRSAYAIGFVHAAARAASLAPWLANFASHAPGLRAVAKKVAGIHPARELPRFARRTFRRSFPREGLGDPGAPRVLLWTDTFNDHFHPDVLWAGARVLAAAGQHVVISEKDLCCGRPLYDYGMLDRARKLLERDVRSLRAEIDAGTPIVGLEPSCTAVFRDEMPNLLHGDERALRLSRQVRTLAEHLATIESYAPPQIDGRLVVQRHCHHASVLGFDADEALLRKTGADVRVLSEGCCGMAGGFGFEREHYDVSMKIAQNGILRALAEEPQASTIVADGFSCRTQVEQGNGRPSKHLAEILDEATRRR